MKDEFSFEEYVGVSLFSVGIVVLVSLASPKFYQDPLGWLILFVVIVVVAIGIYQKKKKIKLGISQPGDNKESVGEAPVFNKIIWFYTTLLMLVTLFVMGPLNKAFSNSQEIVVLLSRHEAPRDLVVYYLSSAFVVLVVLHIMRLQKLKNLVKKSGTDFEK
ncbi:hypothetical protein D3C87_1685200 [compost metagenome]